LWDPRHAKIVADAFRAKGYQILRPPEPPLVEVHSFGMFAGPFLEPGKLGGSGLLLALSPEVKVEGWEVVPYEGMTVPYNFYQVGILTARIRIGSSEGSSLPLRVIATQTQAPAASYDPYSPDQGGAYARWTVRALGRGLRLLS